MYLHRTTCTQWQISAGLQNSKTRPVPAKPTKCTPLLPHCTACRAMHPTLLHRMVVSYNPKVTRQRLQSVQTILWFGCEQPRQWFCFEFDDAPPSTPMPIVPTCLAWCRFCNQYETQIKKYTSERAIFSTSTKTCEHNISTYLFAFSIILCRARSVCTHQAMAPQEKNKKKKINGITILNAYSCPKLSFQTHSGELTKAVKSILNIWDRLAKNSANSGGRAGNTIVGNIKANTCVCVVTSAIAPNAVVACVPSTCCVEVVEVVEPAVNVFFFSFWIHFLVWLFFFWKVSMWQPASSTAVHKHTKIRQTS